VPLTNTPPKSSQSIITLHIFVTVHAADKFPLYVTGNQVEPDSRSLKSKDTILVFVCVWRFDKSPLLFLCGGSPDIFRRLALQKLELSN